ncbi:TonB-dependent receptor [uncultured Parasphingorhabdus sp.]|uniref:TonB-dependent receptor n=1 Tax=uncultured Parasphingorhabdus sp. TaxID=2709694 RepID=UPI002AA6AE76|nr:TonB-dependent receptor [uncultured Parasphingorhabdus sp.]
MKRSIISCLMTASAFIPAAAFAQAAPAAGAEDPNTIIVTARKVSENLQEVPTAVAVVTSESIDRLALNNVADISKTTAGLTFDDSLGRDANRPVIRGQANVLGTSGVAIFIDGIYFSGSVGDYDVDNIERIEVVKGPQSALYGRNTYAGAINIISKTSADRLTGSVSVDISEHDRYDVTANIRGPVTDSITAFASGRYFTNDGEYTNQYDGSNIGEQKSYSFSGGFAFDDGGPFTAQFRTYYNRTEDGQPAIFSTSASDNNCYFDNGSFYGGGGRYFCGTIKPAEINTDYTRQFANNGEDVGLDVKTFNASLKMEYELSDQLTLTSLTGYNKVNDSLVTDGDYSPGSFQASTFATFAAGPGVLGIVNGGPTDFSFASAGDTEDWSQELRLAYDGDRFDIMVGGYYFDQSQDSRDIRELPDNANALALANSQARQAELCSPAEGCFFSFLTDPAGAGVVVVPRNQNNYDIRNWALFGAASFDLSETLTLSVEGRYAEEKVEQTTIARNAGDPPATPVSVGTTFKKFSPRVLLGWQATPDNLLYASFAQGQKPGGFNGVTAIQAGVPSYEAEDVDAFEIGSKNQFLNRALTVNFAAFHNTISGYQLTQNVQSPTSVVSAVVNAGKARVIGMELEVVARPSDNLTFTANYALADSKFKSGFDENQGVLNDVLDDGLVNCSTGDEFPDEAGCQSLFGSIEGKKIPRAPVHQIFADIDYRMPIGAGDWTFFTGANVSVVSSSFAQVHNLAKTGGSAVADFRIGVENENFKIQGYVKNLTDEDAVAQILRYADGNDSFKRNFTAGLRPGRRFGVVFSAKY